MSEVKPKKKYLITNLVYGDIYLNIFLNHHLKSLLDPSNLPTIASKYDITYKIFVDRDTVGKLRNSILFTQLSKVVKVDTETFDWNKTDEGRFSMRYSVLLQAFHATINKALEEKFDYVTAWVADLYVAKNFFPRVMARMDQGHGAVMVLPLRTMFETISPFLQQVNGAIEDRALFSIAQDHLHTLFRNNEWSSPRFTKLPFYLLWSTKTGFMARSFSWTPIVFRPKKEMLEGRGMIDGDVPSKIDEPHWCKEWIEAPVIGVEPVICYAQAFHNHPAQVSAIRDWSRKVLHASQIKYLEKRLYYPDEATVKLPMWSKLMSDLAVRRITIGAK